MDEFNESAKLEEEDVGVEAPDTPELPIVRGVELADEPKSKPPRNGLGLIDRGCAKSEVHS